MPGRSLEALTAAIPVPRRIHKSAVPKHRDLHRVGIEAEVHLLRIADADAARAGAFDEVAVDARLVGDGDWVAGREGRPAAWRLYGLLGQLQPLYAGARHVERKPFLAASLEILQPQLRGSRLKRDAALLGPHAVDPVVVDDQLAVDVEARAVVGTEVERVVALPGDVDVALEHHAEVFAHAGQAGVGRAARGLAGLERLELGKVRQFVPRALVGGKGELVDFALGDQPGGILRAAGLAERADVGDERLHLGVADGGRRRHRRGGLLGHLVHRLADRLGEVRLVERHRRLLAAVA